MGLIPTSGVPEEGRMLGPPGKQDSVQRCLKLSDTCPGLELLTSSLRIHQKNNPKLEFEKEANGTGETETLFSWSLCVTLPREKDVEGELWGSFAES